MPVNPRASLLLEALHFGKLEFESQYLKLAETAKRSKAKRQNVKPAKIAKSVETHRTLKASGNGQTSQNC